MQRELFISKSILVSFATFITDQVRPISIEIFTYFLGNVDLLGMMNNRDRTELRLLLHQHKLLFLRPKYREEHLIEEDKGRLTRQHFIVSKKVN